MSIDLCRTWFPELQWQKLPANKHGSIYFNAMGNLFPWKVIVQRVQGGVWKITLYLADPKQKEDIEYTWTSSDNPDSVLKWGRNIMESFPTFHKRDTVPVENALRMALGLKRHPELLYQIIKTLSPIKILGPWEPHEDDVPGWARWTPEGDALAMIVQNKRNTWEYIVLGHTCASPRGAEYAKKMADKSLVMKGYWLL